jgi:hypothetical protein
VAVGDALGVSDDQDGNSVPKGIPDDLIGCLVVGLVDATTMPGLGLPLAGSLIVQVKVVLSADRPARDQQTRLLANNRIGVDHAKVHTCDPRGVQVMPLDGNSGGDGQPQLAAVGEQGDRSDLFGRVGQGAGHPHPQGRAAPGDGQLHAPLAVKLERAIVESDR